MFAKLQREYARYAAEPQCEHPDYIMNTAITAFHLLEYVRKMVPKLQEATETLGKNDLMKACQDLANKSKHLTLTSQHRTASDPGTEYIDGTIGGSALNTSTLNGGNFWLLTYDDGRQYEISTVLHGVVSLWNDFFKTHF